MNIIRIQLSASLLLVAAICWQCNSKKAPSDREHSIEDIEQMLIDKPNHGYVSNLSPSKWEEAMLTGNGTLGALVMGYPMMDRIIFSHEKLFLPDNPPTLVGIWGGTWKPAWSGDFTLNGNVPSVLAGGLNTNFPEIIEAYIDYMWSMRDDFRDNARDLFGAPGIFVPSRSSDFGKTYHYGSWHPHLFWFAGGAWTAHIFYDYWQYTGDQQFLKEKAIPFMVEAIDFLEYIVTEKEDGTLMFIPSYSPEVGPLKDDPKGHHNLAINATMDVASMKQPLRNLLKLVDQGLLESEKIEAWSSILSRLPDYEVDETGDLKEWIWPDLRNNNRHRHASHLYPLFYEPDPAFLENPELRNAAVTAIENRLSYRRDKNGAEMAFGLVQLGLAAAHVNDVDHAYECVDWLCNSYWSPAFTAYHDPGRIFNVDICGGLPALVTEMSRY